MKGRKYCVRNCKENIGRDMCGKETKKGRQVRADETILGKKRKGRK